MKNVVTGPPEQLQRAISIRQPHAEMILRGEKRFEYRSRRTHMRERVYIYATKYHDGAGYGLTEEQVEALPYAAIIGSIEITDCVWQPDHHCFGYVLAKPRRYRKPIAPKGVPQPLFWFPKF